MATESIIGLPALGDATPPLVSAHARRFRPVYWLVFLLLAGVFAQGVAYAWFWQFSHFMTYDDEGRQLLFVQHLLDGHPLYDQVRSVYGPFYLFQRWLIFSLCGVPLGNDSARTVTVLTWCLSAVFVAATAWRLARGADYAIALAAGVWIATIYYLRVLAYEPGHPQELLVLVLACALWLAVQWGERRKVVCTLLGAATALLVMTKVNIGILFGVGTVVSFLALTPRTSIMWRSARALALLALPMIPYGLMRARLSDGYEPLCLVTTASLLGAGVFALYDERAGSIRFQHFVLFGLGLAVTGAVFLGFAMWQGNTLLGIYRANVVHPRQVYFNIHYGIPLALPLWATIWALVAAGLGVAAHWWKKLRRFLGPLRLLSVGLVFYAVQFIETYDPVWIFLAVPLSWLLLVPPAKRRIDESEWLIRLLLALTVCLQPIQIFPVSGSQNHVGTFLTVLAAVVVLGDMVFEIREYISRRLNPSLRSIVVWLLVLAPTALVWARWPEENGLSPSPSPDLIPQILAAVPSWTIICLSLGTGMGVVAMWESKARRFLWPMKLLIAAAVLLGSLSYGLPRMSTAILIAPWLWLILVRPAGREPGDREWICRVLLVLVFNLLLLRTLSESYCDTLAGLSTLLVAAVLLVDIPDDWNWLGRPRSRRIYGRLIAVLAILAPQGYAALVDLVLYGLLFGSVLTFYREMRSGGGFKRLMIPAFCFGVLLWITVAVTLPAGDILANLNRAIASNGRAKVMSLFLSESWPLVVNGFGLAVVWLSPTAGRYLWPLRLLACGFTVGSLVTNGAWSMPGLHYVQPLAWLVLVPPAAHEIGAAGWILRLFLTLTAVPKVMGVIPTVDNEIPLAVLLVTITSAVLLLDLLDQAPNLLQVRTSDGPVRWSVIAACLALMVGSQLASDAQSAYGSMVPVSFRGCRRTRMSEFDATTYRFLTKNAEASCDCVLAEFGLGSLHFWADRPAVCNVIIPNTWEAIDATADEQLLAAHRDRKNMMFIETSPPEETFSLNLRFLKFVERNFKSIARLGRYRLLVRKERTGLKLYDCGFEEAVLRDDVDNAARLQLRLPQNLVLKDVATIRLEDVNKSRILATTTPGIVGNLVLLDGAGRTLLPAKGGGTSPPLSSADQGLTIVCPIGMPLRAAELPALKFNTAQGRCLLTLPVAVEVSKDVH